MGLDPMEWEKLEAFCVCKKHVKRCPCMECAACRIVNEVPMTSDWKDVNEAWEQRQAQLNEQKDAESKRRVAELTAEAEARGPADKTTGGGKTGKAAEGGNKKSRSRLRDAFKLRKD